MSRHARDPRAEALAWFVFALLALMALLGAGLYQALV